MKHISYSEWSGEAVENLSQIPGLQKMPSPVSGIYFLCLEGVLMYVGESENVFKRVGEHKDKQYDEVFYLHRPASSKSDRVSEEYSLRAQLKPKLNPVDGRQRIAEPTVWSSLWNLPKARPVNWKDGH